MMDFSQGSTHHLWAKLVHSMNPSQGDKFLSINLLTFQHGSKYLLYISACLGRDFPAIDTELIVIVVEDPSCLHTPLPFQIDFVASYHQYHFVQIDALILIRT